MQSEQTNELNAALAKAQANMKAATINKTNPHFKNRYADLAAVLEAVRMPLAVNALAITQTTEIREGGFVLVTTLRHASGQWIASEYPLPMAAKPQELGSALTYARRYSLSAIACIAADEDDDAEVAQTNGQVSSTPAKRENPHVTRIEDATDRRYRVDERGNRIDWIDTSEHRVKHLTGEAQKTLYKTLKHAMLMCKTFEELVAWGEDHAHQVAELGKGEDFFQLMEYQAHLDELRAARKAA